jgi:ATP-binding cassette ChvD family protein
VPAPPPRVPILAASGLTKTVAGGRDVLKDLSFSLFADAKVGIIGRNGSGKSSLLRILAGEEPPTEGQVVPVPGLTRGYVPQEPRLDETTDVAGNLERGVAGIRALLARFEAVNERLSEPLSPEEMEEALEEQARVQEEIERRDGWEVERHVEVAREALRLPPPDAPVRILSGGEKRRVALAVACLSHPDLLLLDEPTNHLDAATVEWLENFLATYHGAWLLVTHDRYFLDHATNQMVEIDRGRLHVYQGNYSGYLEARARRIEVEERQDSARRRVLERELEWIRSTPKARTAKSKARIQRYRELEAEAERSQADRGVAELRLPTGPRLGDRVLSIRGLRKAYGERVLIDGLDLDLPAGGIVGVVGPNGMGKTTLVRMIMGLETPDAGTIALGANTVFCYVDQGRDTLRPDRTVFDEVSEGHETIRIGRDDVNVRTYLSWFQFRGPEQQALVGTLSGGERNRLQLAKHLKRGGNVLVLDEPTNDLDLQTLRVLEEALQAFAGSAIVVTHDRYFLDRVATHVLAFEGDGRVWWSEGTYEHYRERKAERDAEAGLAPESGKGKHRKMVRPGG